MKKQIKIAEPANVAAMAETLSPTLSEITINDPTPMVVPNKMH